MPLILLWIVQFFFWVLLMFLGVLLIVPMSLCLYMCLCLHVSRYLPLSLSPFLGPPGSLEAIPCSVAALSGSPLVAILQTVVENSIKKLLARQHYLQDYQNYSWGEQQ